MTKRLGLSLRISQALGILGLMVAMFFLSTERWTALPISDVFAADLQLVHPATEFMDWDGVKKQCVEAIKSLELVDRPRGPIPNPGSDPGPLVIGCKLADCGPGTDGPGPIDLRITLTGDLAENTILEFENMTVQEAARIGVRGNARHVNGTTRFEVRSGTTVLRGFRANPELRPPVAIPHLTLNREALEAFKQAATVDDLLANSKSSVILMIEQFLGRMDVNEYKMLYIFQHCPPFDPLSIPREPRKVDYVDFGTVAPPNKVTILAPGRVSTGSAGCNDYNVEVVTTGATPGTTVMLNNHLKDEEVGLLPNQCHSEVVVYSKSNALAVVQPVSPPWTDAFNQRVPVVLSAPLPVNVAVWILDDPDGQALDDIKNELNTATKSFDAAMCGITFLAPTIKKIGVDIPFPSGKERRDYLLQQDPERAITEMRPAFYTPGSLNIYMVEGLTERGVTIKATNAESCEDLGQDPSTDSCDEFGDMVLIDYSRRATTVAHEIGHALSLRHTDGVGISFDTTNIMYEVNRTDSKITKGQCYRMNVDRTSFLNTDGGRPADWPTLPARPALLPWPTLPLCPRGTAASTICPTLDFDTTP